MLVTRYRCFHEVFSAEMMKVTVSRPEVAFCELRSEEVAAADEAAAEVVEDVISVSNDGLAVMKVKMSLTLIQASEVAR